MKQSHKAIMYETTFRIIFFFFFSQERFYFFLFSKSFQWPTLLTFWMTSTGSSFNLPWLPCPDSWRVCLASVFHNNTVEKYNYNLYNRWSELTISHYWLNQDKTKQGLDTTLIAPTNTLIYNQFTRVFIVACIFLNIEPKLATSTDLVYIII